jgi:hypothetical protein
MARTTNIEYGGLVYRTADGRYGTTSPVRGSGSAAGREVDPYEALGSVPKGGVVVGDYHSHGNYSMALSDGTLVATDRRNDQTNADHFSGSDREAIDSYARQRGYKAYLGTPNGVFKTYAPNGRESTL